MRFANKYLMMLLIGSSIMTTSCGKKDQVDNSKSETPVVAKVNGDEISIHQLNYQLARLGQLNPEQSKLAARQTLSRLVKQQLFKEKALEAKLDRDPRILQAFEASKDDILVQAYLEQLMSKAEKPSVAQIDGFYQEHPELFSNRKVFRLQELVIDVSKDKVAEVESSLKAIKGINEVAIWLKANNYTFTANSEVRAAEQLSLDLVTKLQPLKEGEFVLLPTDHSINLVHLAASKTEPITREKSTPIIEQYFLNQNKTNLAKKEMDSLYAKANIEFKGEFADMKKEEASKPVPTSEMKVQTKSDIDKSSQNTVKTKSDQSDMDKGLSGL